MPKRSGCCMSTAADLREIATAARPTIRQWLEAAEELAAFSDVCRTKGLEWSQIKAVLKAEYQDEQDGGHRLEKLQAKAERAAEYAELLSPKNISGNQTRAPVEKPADAAPVEPIKTAPVAVARTIVASVEPEDIPPMFDRRTKAQVSA